MTKLIVDKHEGTKTVYTSCRCNCGGNQQCVFKAHVRDGKIAPSIS